MATVREIERRIRSVKNIAQVTRALEAVSASKVRKAQNAVQNTRPYAQEAWRVLTDLSKQAGAGPNLASAAHQPPGEVDRLDRHHQRSRFVRRVQLQRDSPRRWSL